MELAIINPDFATPSRVSSDDRFILSNTDSVTLAHLKDDCVIPVFSKDNQPTISNADFVEAIYEAVQNVFYGEEVLSPAIRVSHPIKEESPKQKTKMPGIYRISKRLSTTKEPCSPLKFHRFIG